MSPVPAAQTSEPSRIPPRLTRGSRVAVIAPSSGFLEGSRLDRGVHALTRLGVSPVLAPGVRDSRGYLAGDDSRRAEDLLWALGDESIDAVWCAKGGYGAARTVAALGDGALDELRDRPPRAFIGYSDITVLHALISARLGWVSFYGPVISDLIAPTAYTRSSVQDALFAAAPFQIGPDPDDGWVSTLVGGTADGVLAGGCLTLLAALAGTELQVNFAGKIAFFEDVDEEPYRIDGYLSQLLAAGCFDGCAGIVIGDHVDSEPDGPSLGLEQVFADLLAPLGVPSCFYMPIGHGRHKATVPIGAAARFDADRGTLDIIDSPVS